MARHSYVQLFIDGEYKLVPKSDADKYRRRKVQIMPDMKPYKSMITGEMIEGRASHREHLRRHGCIEVGNEKIEGKLYHEHDPKDEIKRTLYDVWENVSQEGPR